MIKSFIIIPVNELTDEMNEKANEILRSKDNSKAILVYIKNPGNTFDNYTTLNKSEYLNELEVNEDFGIDF